MRILLLLAVVLSGCGQGSSSFEPAQASAGPQPTGLQARTFQAAFDDGSGRATMALQQDGTSAHGTAVVQRGAATRVMAVTGVVNGDQVSLYLFPRAGNTQPLTLAGQLGGPGRWLERGSDATGGVTLRELAETLPLPTNYRVTGTNRTLVMQLQFQSKTIGSHYEGVWNSNQPLGYYKAENGKMHGSIVGGSLVVELDNGSGYLNFAVPTETSRSPLYPDECYVVFNSNGTPQMQIIEGFVQAD